jgi:two-component system OmpR family response regulator
LLKSIFERPWTAEDRSIDNLVVRLRRKLGEDPRDPRLIRTVRGGGYVLAAAVRVTRRREAASPQDGTER